MRSLCIAMLLVAAALMSAEATYSLSYGQYYGQHNQGQGLSGVGNLLTNAAGNVVGTVTNAAGNVVGTVTNAAGNVVGTVTKVADNVIDTVGNAAGNVVGTVGNAAGNLVGTVTNAAGNVIGTVAKATGNLVGITDGLLRELTGTLNNVLKVVETNLGGVVGGAVRVVLYLAGPLLAKVVSILQYESAFLFGILRAKINITVSIITSLFSKLLYAILGSTEGVLLHLLKALGISIGSLLSLDSESFGGSLYCSFDRGLISYLLSVLGAVVAGLGGCGYGNESEAEAY